uniref:Uncharacterized protein n=1 Tax=Melopsittacus undulatus TaxID=13146 RepID=A0A8V5GUG6_MELUD
MYSQRYPYVIPYFVVAGLPPSGAGPEEEPRPKEPITDVALIARAQGEEAPLGYTCIEATPTGTPAELSAGLRERLCLCYRRGRDRAPLVELGVHYEGAEPRAGHVLVRTTPYSRGAALRGGGAGAPRAFLSFRRARAPAGPALLGVSDLCLVAPARGESAPHAYCREGRSLSAGPWGPALYLCYKLSMASANTLVYEAALLSRYPAEDTASFPLPASVPVFCLPMGATVESWPSGAQFPLPLFTPFVLTGASGDKVYGASLQFHESVSPERLSERQLLRLGLLSLVERVPVPGRSAHGRRSIALLSRWPFFRVFRSFLTFLYRYSISGPHVLPIEAHISHFMHNVPFPSPQRPRILVQLSPYDSVLLCRPVSSPLPLSGASFLSLVRCVGPDTALVLLVAVLTEHKVLIHSLRPHRLTSVGEALVAMIFPLRWQCPYIPLCPLPLWDVLSAPVPFIVGLHSSYFDLHEPPRDVVCVDLDTNTVTPQERKLLPPRALPRRPCKDVDLDLALVLGDAGTGGTGGTGVTGVTGDAGGRRAQLELQVQAAFLRFMACVLRGYRSFLRPVQLQSPPGGSDTHNLFDMQGFLRSRERGYHRFYSQLLRTQLFAQFLEECSFGADREPCLDFFDACVDKVQPDLERPEDTPLIEVDDARGGERTVLITPPEQPVAPDGSELPAQYHYDGFPTLRPELLEPPREPLVAQLCQARSSAPSSPAPCRTQQEMKAAQRVAQRSCSVPELWGRFLLGHCYGLWFLYLPSHVRAAPARLPALHQAYGVLRRMERHKVVLPDEVCYRVLLQLCGQYGEPVLAVRVMLEMKRAGIVPNAVTYGYYNKAVLESKWPSGAQSARRHWAMLRNVVLGVARFRQPLRQRHRLLPAPPSIARARGPALPPPPPPQPHGCRGAAAPEPPNPPRMGGGAAGGAGPRRGLGAKLQQLLSPARRGTGLTPPRGRGGGTPPQRSSGGTLRAAERPESEVRGGLPMGLTGVGQVLLSSCSRCPGCGALVYDEEVMAGWSSDDSNLNTTCPFCTRCFLPFLSIEIRPPEPGPSPPPGPVLSDRSRCLALDESDTEQSNGSDQAVVRRECASFAYLSPLVLRKELERALEAEGGAALARAALWGARPILFWNLLWCFRRLALPSGLPRLLLPHGTQLPPSGSVRVRLLWDVLTPEPDTCPPLYVLWHLHSECGPMGLYGVSMGFYGALWGLFPMGLYGALGVSMGSLWFSMGSLWAAFDRKYRSAFTRLAGNRSLEQLRLRRAQPPSPKAIDCRKSFGPPPEC